MARADATPDGASIFKAKCAVCHGADGKRSNKPMKIRDLTSADVQKATDDELYARIADGKGTMPAFRKVLSDGEIKALVVHLRDLAR